MREGSERCGSPGTHGLMLHRNVSGPCTIPGVSPLFHPGQRSGDVVVPQGRALVNSKPYPARLFFWRGSSVYRCPWGTNINIAAAAEKTSPTSPCLRPHQQEFRRATALAWLAATLHHKLCRRPRTRRGDFHSRPRRTTKPTYLLALCPCRLPDKGTQAYQATTPSSHSRQGASGRRSPGLSAYRLYGFRSHSPAWLA